MDQFYHLLFALILSVCSTHAHKCAHDEYVHSHNVNTTISPQTYLNHPFETRHDTDTSRRLNANWQPIRIHVDQSDSSHASLSSSGKATLNKITSSIIPLAIKILNKHLHVVPVNGNLKVTPSCLYTINGKSCCETNPSQCHWSANTCAEVAVPPSHNSPGIPSTDFVVYLKANEENHGETMALGVACKRDQHDRPLAGQVILNLHSWKETYPQNYMVSVLTHEMSHALGWTHDSFEKFRDSSGNLRSNVITSQNALGKTISLLSTPAVTSQVRSHFGCNSLAGMEIEDQGGRGTAGSHPEKRIFPESYMAGVSASSVSDYTIDAMALSVFQDSGWYQVKHLDQAGSLTWGRGMGCRVATHKCNDFGDDANAKGLFCSNKSATFCTGHHMHVTGYCDLVQYSGSLPSMFQYFSSPTTGGHIQIADFCPRANQWSNGDCTDTSFQSSNDVPQAVEHGSDSRCFHSSLLSRRFVPHKNAVADASCYKRTCRANALEIHVGSHTVSCPVSKVPSSVTVDGYYGYIVCPAYAGLGDIRCNPICSKNDIDCLGIKGKSVDVSGADWGAGGGTVVVSGRNLRH